MKGTKPPDRFCPCCGWWNVWCVLDTILHAIGIKNAYICDRHEDVITR